LINSPWAQSLHSRLRQPACRQAGGFGGQAKSKINAKNNKTILFLVRINFGLFIFSQKIEIEKI